LKFDDLKGDLEQETRAMLASENNLALTKVGPDTPLGRMMRRYWHPIALSSQVAEPDGSPLRAKLLGQNFVVFRDTNGKVGVLDEACPHRGVSLALGRNEEGGLRCLYHGWKFSVEGSILEMPNSADCRLLERWKASAYPVREQSGLIWTYVGPAEQQPPFRIFAFDQVPDLNRVIIRTNCKASWLPLWEGGVDSAHVGILHTNAIRPSWGAKVRDKPTSDFLAMENLVPQVEAENTEYGFDYCALRDLPPGGEKVRNARIVPSALPYVRIIPFPAFDLAVLEVPMDDFETANYLITYSQNQRLDRAEVARFHGLDGPQYDGAACEVELDWSNRMGQDRSIMRSNWTGYTGVQLEDFAMSASMSPEWDRSGEHLVASDKAVVYLRHRILEAIRLNEAGEDPLGLMREDMTDMVASDMDLGPEELWQDIVSSRREAIHAKPV
jgi:phthalate 4,5-dioxygenase